MLSRKPIAGFTLVEMIGVMAVIAILASVATPRIIDSIEDAKISSFIQETKTLEGAVAKFYADTGKWPDFDTNYDKSSNPHYYQLTYNAADASGTTISGWQGPYVETIPNNPFTEGARVGLYDTDDSNYTCDVDGDGSPDGMFMSLRVDGVTDKVAEKISNILDGDGGSTSWKTTGRVKRYGGTHTSILIVCLSRI